MVYWYIVCKVQGPLPVTKQIFTNQKCLKIIDTTYLFLLSSSWILWPTTWWWNNQIYSRFRMMLMWFLSKSRSSSKFMDKFHKAARQNCLLSPEASFTCEGFVLTKAQSNFVMSKLKWNKRKCTLVLNTILQSYH